VNTDGLLKVLHSVIDLLGGGAQHLHADLDAAAGRVPPAEQPPALTDAEQATLEALQARQAAIAAAAVPAQAPAGDAS
jgi:hypothetical protein